MINDDIRYKNTYEMRLCIKLVDVAVRMNAYTLNYQYIYQYTYYMNNFWEGKLTL